jgi:hypothetical protein
MMRMPAPWRSAVAVNSSPCKVAGVASTATTPLRVASAAGFTAGSMPMKGMSGNFARRCFKAAAEALLQATTMALQFCASRKRTMPSA